MGLIGTLFIPTKAGCNNRLPGAVMCHGYGGDREAFAASAAAFAEEGIAVLTFDFRGHGESGGLLDDNIVDDVIDAWDFLGSQPEVEPGRIGLIGHSMGAFSAIMAAGRLKKAVVLVALGCPGELMNKALSDTKHILHPMMRHIATIIFKIATAVNRLKVRTDWKKFIGFWPGMRPSQAMAGLEDCSKLFVFCLNDITSPYNRFLFSYATASEPKQVMIGPGHHNTMIEPGYLRSQWQKWAVDALQGKSNYSS